MHFYVNQMKNFGYPFAFLYNLHYTLMLYIYIHIFILSVEIKQLLDITMSVGSSWNQLCRGDFDFEIT